MTIGINETAEGSSGLRSTAGAPAGRWHTLDFIRGVACLTMPFYHGVYNLYVVGLTSTLWTKNTFWLVYQKLGLGTFVLVSGMAFMLSTRRGVNWGHLRRRFIKLAAIAGLISLVTALAMPNNFVRFGVLHFFALTILLAPLCRGMGPWLMIPGAAITLSAFYLPRGGLFPEPWLYITGLMSQRPPSVDYIPLVPWFGVFLLGMGLMASFSPPTTTAPPARWMRPVIWLGKHSLWFYLGHQAFLYVLLWSIALLLRG